MFPKRLYGTFFNLIQERYRFINLDYKYFALKNNFAEKQNYVENEGLINIQRKLKKSLRKLFFWNKRVFLK